MLIPEQDLRLEGTRTLGQGAGAHVVENSSDEHVRVLIVRTMVYPDVVEHLDGDTLLVLTAPPQLGADDIGLVFSRDHGMNPAAGDPPE